MTATIRNDFDRLVLAIKNYKKQLKLDYEWTLENSGEIKHSPDELRNKYKAVCHILDIASNMTENNVHLPSHMPSADLDY